MSYLCEPTVVQPVGKWQQMVIGLALDSLKASRPAPAPGHVSVRGMRITKRVWKKLVNTRFKDATYVEVVGCLFVGYHEHVPDLGFAPHTTRMHVCGCVFTTPEKEGEADAQFRTIAASFVGPARKDFGTCLT